MTPWVARLVYANALVFLASIAFPAVFRALVLVPALIIVRPWTIVSYMFLHGDLFHLLFNMLGLFFFGPRLELWLGGRRFLLLYFLSGAGGAVLSFLFAPFAGVVGASGAVFGVLMGFAMRWPNETIYIWGVLPIRARVLVVIMTVLALWGGFGEARDGIAHFAHLGGFGAGFLYLKWLDRRSPARRFRERLEAPAPTAPPNDAARLETWEQIPREELHAVNREELERLLAKARAFGPARLSVDERAFLDRLASD